MMNRILFMLLMIGAPLTAEVTIRSNISDLEVGRDGQRAGAVSVVITGDDFSGASSQTPIFIRLSMSHGATLCETLVGAGDDPIYVPLRLDNSGQGYYVGADPETAAIVRWRSGEDQIWIRIQSPTNTWIDSPAGPVAPNEDLYVSFVLGFSAFNSDGVHVSEEEALIIHNANLPHHTRKPHGGVSHTNAVSTLFCTNLKQSTLQPLPASDSESILRFDPTAWLDSKDVATAPSTSAIRRGSQWAVGFPNDTRFGRGLPQSSCELAMTVEPSVTKDQDTLGQSCLQRNMSMELICNGLIDSLHTGAVLEMEVQGAAAGFPVMVDEQGQPVPLGDGFALVEGALAVSQEGWTQPFALAKDVINVNGTFIALKCQTAYEAAGPDSGYFMAYEVTLCGDLGPGLALLNRISSPYRDSPYAYSDDGYDGPEQVDYCTPEPFTAQSSVSLEL